MKKSEVLRWFLALVVGLATMDACGQALERAHWQEARKGIDYGERDVPETEEPTTEAPRESYQTPSAPSWSIPTLGVVGTSILYAIVILGLVFLLVRMINNSGMGGKVKHSDQAPVYSFEELEEHIHETELERYLRLALERQEFRSAIRVYYLMVIKALSEGNRIRWKRDKTNFDYVREMMHEPEFDAFREVTHAFEVVWYGDAPLDSGGYRALSPRFEQFLKRINPTAS